MSISSFNLCDPLKGSVRVKFGDTKDFNAASRFANSLLPLPFKAVTK